MEKLMWAVCYLLLFKIISTQKCVLMGANDQNIPFINDGPPIRLDPENLESLKENCPHLISSKIEDTRVCCTQDQLEFLVSQLGIMDQMFQSCTQCKFSIKSVFCNLACSPKQAYFLKVLSVGENNTVESSSFSVSHKYMQGVFDSCKDNKDSQTGQLIINNFGLQVNSSGDELIRKFLEFSPYKISLQVYKKASVQPSLEMFYPCSESKEFNNILYQKCSCAHCTSGCIFNVSFSDPQKKLFFNFLNYYDIAILSVWVFIIIAVPISFIMRAFSKRRGNLDVLSRKSTSLSDTELGNPLPTKKKPKLSIVLRGMKYIIDRLCRVTVRYRYASMSFFLLLAIGFSVAFTLKIRLTSDPMDLWVPDGTEITNNYKDFNKHFGGFFRTEQIIITSKAKSVNSSDYTGSAFNKELFYFTAKLLEDIKKLNTTYTRDGKKHVVKLNDICYKPTAPEYDNCAIFSPIEYFQGSLEILEKVDDEWMDHLDTCISTPATVKDNKITSFVLPCLSSFLTPIDPKLVFGGYPGYKVNLADTIIMTITVENHEKKEDQIPAIEWERKFIKFVKNLNHSSEYTIAFNSEVSVEDELYRGSFKDVKIAAISYFLMFVYVCLGIGKFSVRFKDLMVDLKVCTAIGGILIIIFSVSTTLGIFVLAGYKINLIVVEVLPFLLLAIGADNFFLLDHYFMSTLMNLYEKGNLSIRLATQKAIRKAGVGICLSALVNTCTFFIGMVNDMPVVKFFSFASAVAMIITFIFQITIFIPLMYLDNLRMLSNRVTLFFIKVEENVDHPVGDSERYREGPIRMYVRKVHQNIVTHRYVAYAILTTFVLVWGAMLICATKLHVGLDQKMALPTDSYLQNYFTTVFDKLKIGAPYFVVIPNGVDYSKHEVQDKFCTLNFCQKDSLGNLLTYAVEESKETHIAKSTNNWIDTFFQWLEGGLPSCCMEVKQIRKKNSTVYQNIDKFMFCTREMYNSEQYKCDSCLPTTRNPMRPNEEEFNFYLPKFLNDMPSIDGCIHGGKAAFKTSVILNPDYYSNPRKSNISVITSRFMGYHTQLVTSKSFIDALNKALKIEEILKKMFNFDVYLYSIFYVYYQGYINLIFHAVLVYALMCLGLAVFTFVIFFFKVRISIIYAVTVIMTNISILFMMFIFQIKLNPVSLVNIIMMFAISVEFSIHIAVAYMNSRRKNPIYRVRDALMHSGASVFSGIAVTKIVGVSVLAFASSKIFIEYYFKMYCFAIVSGMLHGLIFLPACLSIFGPEGDEDEEIALVSLSE